jgi:NAD(P) transhydrogenase subunit beta
MSNFIAITYLFSAICFICSLQGLSSAKTARIGNILGVIGMAAAILATIYAPGFKAKIPTILSMLMGGSIGFILAKRIKITDLPQLVAAFHSLVGLAAVLVAFCALIAPENFKIGLQGHLPASNLFEMALGCSIGAITFTGSVVAFAKLQALIPSRPLFFKFQQYINLSIILLILFCLFSFINSGSLFLFSMITILSMIIGVLLIVPVGGADMPVIVSMLNSYSGWAASGIGFTLNNHLLIITGALVGSSGAILSYVMCKAMNRSIFKVIFGAFIESNIIAGEAAKEDRKVNISSAEDAAFLLKNATSVIIVPGYGMATAQAQHAIKEMTSMLQKEGIEVRFAIHPVAGRMPGHMNVLLAEANIDYDQVFELEDINRDFARTDIVLVVGANDVTNPAAKTDKASPIYGMPVLDVGNARTVLFIKRSMSSGYAGIENELFYQDNVMMLFGDAKKVVEDIVKSLD